ncbi:MAG: magnetic particle specific iron-binding protein [Magnetococcales bacterium]|nr:magnetic particle specific iron-binding protein [Magnetococcales bacterium]
MGTIPPGLEWELPEAAKAGVAKGTVVKGAVVKGGVAKGTVKGAGVALQGGAANGAVVAAAGAAPANAVATTAGATAAAQTGGGTIWTGTGMKLGWGLGLGAWGPVILAGVVTAVGVGVYSYLKNRTGSSELEEATS